MNEVLKNVIETTDFQSLFERKGYAYFTKGDYNLNIIGIRDLREGIVQRDNFNDALVCTYKINGKWYKDIWSISTDPGLKMLGAPMNSAGTAILVPGQYRGAYQIGLHKGQYQALTQKKPVKVFRDRNKDNKLDFNSSTIQEGMFGINIHGSMNANLSATMDPNKVNPTWESSIVGSWSAGCQVFKNAKDYAEFMTLCRKAKDIYGNSFTYTLLTTDFD